MSLTDILFYMGLFSVGLVFCMAIMFLLAVLYDEINKEK